MECSRKVMDILTELGADPENTKFHAIHRTGNSNTTASSNSAVSNGVSTESREGASRPYLHVYDQSWSALFQEWIAIGFGKTERN